MSRGHTDHNCIVFLLLLVRFATFTETGSCRVDQR